MNKKKLGIIVVLMVSLVGGIFLLNYSTNEAIENSSKITYKKVAFDTGAFKVDISIPSIQRGIEDSNGIKMANSIITKEILDYIQYTNIISKIFCEDEDFEKYSLADQKVCTYSKGDLLSIRLQYLYQGDYDYDYFYNRAYSFDKKTGRLLTLEDIIPAENIDSVYDRIREKVNEEYAVKDFYPERSVGVYVDEETIGVIYYAYQHFFGADYDYTYVELPIDETTQPLLSNYNAQKYALGVSYESREDLLSEENLCSVNKAYYMVLSNNDQEDELCKEYNQKSYNEIEEIIEQFNNLHNKEDDSLKYYYLKYEAFRNEGNLVSFYRDFSASDIGDCKAPITLNIREGKEISSIDELFNGDYATIIDDYISNDLRENYGILEPEDYEGINDNTIFYLTDDTLAIFIKGFYKEVPLNILEIKEDVFY